MGVGAFVTVVLLSSWSAFRPMVSFSRSLELHIANALEQHVLVPRPRAIPVEERNTLQALPIPLQDTKTDKFPFGIDPSGSKIVHFGKDVTVRHFTPELDSPSLPVERYQVIHIGKDVTVRYFKTVSRINRK